MNENTADIVRDILTDYDQYENHQNLPISVDILKEIVQRRCGLNSITVLSVPVELPHVLGQIKFYYPVPKAIRTNESPTVAVIRIQESLNFCWQRLVVCKELCHCLIDTEAGDRVTTEEDFIALFEGLASRHFFNETGVVNSERLAELLALELLFPYELRVSHVQALKAGRITPYSLALRYRIPEEYASIGMHDSHMATMATKYSKNRPKLTAVK